MIGPKSLYTYARKRVLSNLIETYCRQGAIRRRVVVDGIPLIFVCRSYGDFRRPKNAYKAGNSELLWLSLIGPGDVVWDIGANIGAYSLLPGARMQTSGGGGMVYAFEPEARNYAKLNENIRANGLGTHVQALPLAVGSHKRADRLFVKESSGGSGHSIGASNFHPIHIQGIVEMTADDIVMLGVRPPRHVKIDVDGYEFDVVSGMGRMLNGRNLRTIHIELDEHAGGREAARVLEGAGFTVAHVQSWPQYPGISNMLFRRAS